MMQSRLIYRIEDEDGYGPFQSLPPGVDWQHYNDDVENFPSPANDPGIDEDTVRQLWLRDGGRWDDRIGCCSCEQLRHWFGFDVCAALTEYGFQFVTYSVPEHYVIAGAFQAIFDAEHADPVDRKPALALWTMDTQTSLKEAA